MKEFKTNPLKNYIENSVIIEINDWFKIRLTKELLINYESKIYSKGLEYLEENIKKIKELDIKYPGNANPIFYLYIVPNENFVELLNFPTARSSKGGGKPVPSYDLEGFNSAYGLSSNMLENRTKPTIMRTVNSIHELAHLVHSMFFNQNRFLCEGFAESLPLYTMDYESKFEQHKELLKTLEKKQILSAQELIELEEKKQFTTEPLIPNTSCSFELPYISSYLFVRGCLEIIASQFKINRNEATQKFLEIMKQSK